ncbi:unnamed protein product [Cladocopium goreaui]|uniref:Uncharacterized protein n=1 Tax=Cladocopium goreaui TaxID=2562237 RepID=A0A9P1FWC2_9DINO|nr:unnamed protein product [Cladocopium goreaui]
MFMQAHISNSNISAPPSVWQLQMKRNPMVQNAMEILRTRSPKTHSTSRCEACLARPLARSIHLLSSGENCGSGFANCSARSLPSDSGKFHQGSSFGDGLGRSLRLKLLAVGPKHSQ